jgi:hypothetical protein
MNGRVTPDRWDESESEEGDLKEEKSQEDDPEEEKPPHSYHGTAPEDKIINRYFFKCGADLNFSTDVTRYIEENILHNTANLKSVRQFKYIQIKNIFYGFSDDGSIYDGIFVATFYPIDDSRSNFWDIRIIKPSNYHTTALGILEVLTVMGQSGHKNLPIDLESGCDLNDNFLRNLVHVYESFDSRQENIQLPMLNSIQKSAELFLLDTILKSYTGASTYEIREKHNRWRSNQIVIKLHSKESTYFYKVLFNTPLYSRTRVVFSTYHATDFQESFVRPEDIGRDVVTPYYKDPSDKDPKDYSDGYDTE